MSFWHIFNGDTVFNLPSPISPLPAPAPAKAIALISRELIGGELLYHAHVQVNGDRSFVALDRPDAQSICLDVLDWAQRQGKEVDWQYQNLNI